MKRLLLAALLGIGLLLALANAPNLGAQGTYDSIALDFQETLTDAQIQQQVEAIAQRYHVTPQLNSAFSAADHLYVVAGDARLLKLLRRSDLRQSTESIDPNYIYQAFEIPNDPDYSKQWNLRTINMESAWHQSKGSGVTVAIIDTGVTVVLDLKDTAFVPGYDFVNDSTDASDDNGHGTHIAGTIAQSTNNNFGVAGIAYEASLMPLKVLSQSGGGTVTDIAEAIRFAADHGAGVINISLGGSGDAAVMQEAIAYAHNKGVVIVAAAGNGNSNAAAFPSRYPNVIAVAALDASGVRAPYSNFGAGVDIAAPGGVIDGENMAGGILQHTIDAETGEPVFRAFQGTSMAAPHVAAVAALVESVGIKDPDTVTAILQKSARAVPDDALNRYGAGRLDADAAVKLAQQDNLDVKDFLRWLRDSGYFNLRFWVDGGAVALLPKLGMVLGSYLLAWLLRRYVPVLRLSLGAGLIVGSSGLFPLRGFYIFDLPQFPFRVLGSSIAELGGVIQGSTVLNPIFASVLIPFILVALLLSHPQWKWVAIGCCLGVAACLAVNAIGSPQVLWLGSGAIARSYLLVNALLCFGLAKLGSQAS